MIQNYFKTAWRNIIKQKGFTVVNILGLTLGIAASVVIINYITYEFGYDIFHTKRNRIYRVESKFFENGELTDDWATSAFGYGSAIKKEIPGIAEVVRLPLNQSQKVVRYNNIKLRENTVTYAEPSFFKVFDYALLKGDKATCLAHPNTVVITEAAAKKLFPNENPLGKRLIFAAGENTLDCEVTGLLQDFPSNSHIRFDYIISYASLPQWMKDFWYIHSVYTYVLLQPDITPQQIEKGFLTMAKKYKTDEALKNKQWAISLIPLSDIHLNKQKPNEREVKGSKRVLLTLLAIAIVILLLAWINYVNITTARFIERAKEVGVRKVSGATRPQLIQQFLLESWIINSIAIILAAAVIIVAYPYFNSFVGKPVGWVLFTSPFIAVSFVLLLAVGMSLSGFFPAFVLSAVMPSHVLKGRYKNSSKGRYLQKTLVVFQFASALFLLCGVFIIKKQMGFMQRQDLAVDIDRTIVMKYPVNASRLDSTVQLYADYIKTLPGIKTATVAGAVPGMEIAMFASNAKYGQGKRENKLYEMLTVDDEYMKMFGLQTIAGRAFEKAYTNDQNNILVNESCLESLKIRNPKEAIGQKISLEGDTTPVEIVGVVKNWHQRGLNNKYTPVMLVKNGRISWIAPAYIAVKTGNSNLASVTAMLKTAWDKYFPDSSFDSFYLSDYFNEQYTAEQNFGSVVTGFTIIAFFISLMGLWALSSYTARQKVKEVGIRKVFGADSTSIFLLLSKSIFLLVLIALLIAIPVFYIVMSRWLLHFPFRTNIDAVLYLTGGFITMTAALLTVLWQSWKVIKQNPVKSLRTE